MQDCGISLQCVRNEDIIVLHYAIKTLQKMANTTPGPVSVLNKLSCHKILLSFKALRFHLELSNHFKIG